MRLIDNWRKTLLHSWSIRIGAALSSLAAYLLASPETMLAVLNQMPADMRALLPPALPFVVWGLVTFVRLIRQEKLSGPK